MNNTTHKNRQEILNKADKAFLVGVADDVADKCSFCGKCCVFRSGEDKVYGAVCRRGWIRLYLAIFGFTRGCSRCKVTSVEC